MRIISVKAALFAVVLLALMAAAPAQAATTSTAPGINVIIPVGGETLEQQATTAIIWNYTVDPGPGVRILLMQNGSAVRTIVANTLSHPPGIPQGTYSWTIPKDIPDGSYQIKVESLANTAVSGISRPFTIKFIPSYLRFDNPKAGNTLTAGTTVPLVWSYHGYYWNSTTIFLKKRFTNKVWTVASKIPLGSNGKGAYNWQIPADVPTGGDYYLVHAIESVNGWAESGDTGNFTIQNPKMDFLQLTSPVNNPQWRAGAPHTITWKYTPYLNFNVNIGYKTASGNTPIVSALPVGSNGAGSYNWNIPEKLAPGEYTLYIVATGGASLSDSQNFTVNVPESIRVDSPRKDYLFEIGKQLGVVWYYSGEPGPYVNVMLQNWNTGASQVIGQNLAIANKIYHWTIPENTEPGYYRITVQSPAKSSYQATSEVFKIVKPSTVDLIAPETASGWYYGAICKIAWMQHLNTLNATVTIQLKKAGKYVRTIASAVALSQGQQHQSYDWTIPSDLLAGSDYTITITLKDGNFYYEDTGPQFGIGPRLPVFQKPVLLPH